MRIINDDEVRAVLDMPSCITAMETAFRELGEGIAVSHPRQRYKVIAQTDRPGYMANIIPGAVPAYDVAALRYDSMLVQEREIAGKRRMEFQYPDRRSWGFVWLFSLTTGEPLAVIQDFSLSSLRVGATTGVAVKRLARSDASVVGLFGSGNEARRNLEAIGCVRSIESVRVYSPNWDHRNSFAKEMEHRLGVSIRAVSRPEEVVKGADIIMCATNSSQPVFDGHWLCPGQLVVTIANTDHVHYRSEADATTFLRSDRIVVNHRASVENNRQRELLDLVESGEIPQERILELADIVSGRRPGRTRDDELVYYKSNSGMGIQFAASCAIILRHCVERGLGHEIPTEWFGADVGSWLDQGYLPSP